MLINEKKLKKIKVETQSGQALGVVVGFELETETGTIIKYYVKSKVSIAGLFENKLVINKEQVISFDDQKMVVADNLIKETKSKKQTLPKVEKVEGTEPVIKSKTGN